MESEQDQDPSAHRPESKPVMKPNRYPKHGTPEPRFTGPANLP